MLDENSKDYFREKAVLSSKSASNFTHNIRIGKLALNNLVMLNWKKVSSCKETNNKIATSTFSLLIAQNSLEDFIPNSQLVQ